MKMYTKPELFVTEFTPNEALTVCPEYDQTEWANQKIDCVIEGEETIFYTGCTTNASSSGMLGQYDNEGDGVDNNDWYYAWEAAPTTNEAPTTEQSNLLDAIISALQGLTSVQSGIGKGWHAGVATPEVIKVHNMS